MGHQPPSDDQIDDEIHAYVLGLLGDEEAARFEARLATSPELRARVDRARAVTWLLAASPAQLAPSAGLRARILAAADAERQEPAPVRHHPSVRAVPAPPRQQGQPAAGWRQWLAAAGFLLSLGLGGWTVLLQQQITRQQTQIDRQQADLARSEAALEALGGAERFWTMRGAPEHAPNATSVLALNADQKQAVLIVRGFPPLPAGQSYQIWVIVNGQPVSVGIFVPSSPESEYTLVIPSDLGGVTQAAITIEPTGGSLSPTGPKVMAGDL